MDKNSVVHQKGHNRTNFIWLSWGLSNKVGPTSSYAATNTFLILLEHANHLICTNSIDVLLKKYLKFNINSCHEFSNRAFLFRFLYDGEHKIL